MRHRRSATFAALALIVTACIPTHAAYLTIPMETIHGRDASAALVVVALDELAARMEPFDRDRLAFWERGREPVPHALIDHDGDGELDHAVLRVAVTEGSELVVTCPGPVAEGTPPGVGRAATPEVRLDYEAARR